MIQKLTVSGYKKMPWKNGAGYTLELARSEGDSLDAFDWRISMADVKTSGEFSLFNGMQRVLTVLKGKGISLNIDNAAPTILGHMQSLAFSGDSKVSCELVDGAIRDFNLIYNPSKLHARYQWLHTFEPAEWLSSAEQIFIFNQSADSLQLLIDGQRVVLDYQDSVNIKKASLMTTVVLPEHSKKHCCVIELLKK